jgi:hypothetical protein
MQFNIFTLHPTSILFWVFCIGFIVMIMFIGYIYRYGGIGTAVLYYQKGNTLRMYRAQEDEKSVGFGDKAFSKVVLDSQGDPETGEDGKYKVAAQPAVMWRRFKPYRIFYAQEGYPTILPFDRNTPITDVTASDLNALSRGAFAQGLAKHLLKSASMSIWMFLFIFLFGLVCGLFFFPLVFP